MKRHQDQIRPVGQQIQESQAQASSYFTNKCFDSPQIAGAVALSVTPPVSPVSTGVSDAVLAQSGSQQEDLLLPTSEVPSKSAVDGKSSRSSSATST